MKLFFNIRVFLWHIAYEIENYLYPFEKQEPEIDYFYIVKNDETGEEYDDDTRVEFYIGDYEDGDNDIFKWYDCEYFYEDSEPRNRCPLVVIEHPYDNTLVGYFGDKWEEPFKKWFTENFDLPVKTVEWKRLMD